MRSVAGHGGREGGSSRAGRAGLIGVSSRAPCGHGHARGAPDASRRRRSAPVARGRFLRRRETAVWETPRPTAICRNEPPRPRSATIWSTAAASRLRCAPTLRHVYPHAYSWTQQPPHLARARPGRGGPNVKQTSRHATRAREHAGQAFPRRAGAGPRRLAESGLPVPRRGARIGAAPEAGAGRRSPGRTSGAP